MYLIWDGQIVDANGDPAEVVMYVSVQCDTACSLTSFPTASNDGLPMNGVISSLMPLSWIELGFLSTSCHSKSHYCSWILISSPNLSRKQHISRAPEVSLLTECSNRSLIGLDLRTMIVLLGSRSQIQFQ